MEEENQLERGRRGLCGHDENVLILVLDGTQVYMISQTPETEHQDPFILLYVNNTVIKKK